MGCPFLIQLTGPGLGYGGFWTARRTLAGYEAMAMIRRGLKDSGKMQLEY
jgi:hypothetical protein